jgi:hypothetical protein
MTTNGNIANHPWRPQSPPIPTDEATVHRDGWLVARTIIAEHARGAHQFEHERVRPPRRRWRARLADPLFWLAPKLNYWMWRLALKVQGL